MEKIRVQIRAFLISAVVLSSVGCVSRSFNRNNPDSDAKAIASDTKRPTDGAATRTIVWAEQAGPTDQGQSGAAQEDDSFCFYEVTLKVGSDNVADWNQPDVSAKGIPPADKGFASIPVSLDEVVEGARRKHNLEVRLSQVKGYFVLILRKLNLRKLDKEDANSKPSEIGEADVVTESTLTSTELTMVDAKVLDALKASIETAQFGEGMVSVDGGVHEAGTKAKGTCSSPAEAFAKLKQGSK